MRSESALFFVLVGLACSSESAEQHSPSTGGANSAAGRSGSGGTAGASGAGASGKGGAEAQAGGGADAGGEGNAAGASGAGDQGGASGGEAGASGTGASGAPGAASYRWTGSASALLDAGEGGTGGEGSGDTGGASGGGEAGSGAGAGAALPTIDRVECSISVDLVDVSEVAEGDFSAVAIGEVFRNVYSGERRWEFSAFIAGPATLSVGEDGTVELRAVGDQSGAKPFWQELEVLSGHRTAPREYAGTWTCSTLALADPGFPDVEGDAPGSWQLVPLEPRGL